jgi:hypothetical protein
VSSTIKKAWWKRARKALATNPTDKHESQNSLPGFKSAPATVAA